MFEEFGEAQFSRWCELYLRIMRDGRLAQVLSRCRPSQLQRLLLAATDAAMLLPEGVLEEDSLLQGYAALREIERRYLGNTFRSLQTNLPEARHQGNRHILCHADDSPLLQAVAPQHRFKLDRDLGQNPIVQLRCHWCPVAEHGLFDFRVSSAFDPLLHDSHRHLKVGLSPIAQPGDMRWCCDADDGRGETGDIPFWCAGAHDESVLHNRILSVLKQAYEEKVDLLLFPELTITPNLENAIASWLAEHNLWQPVMRLVVAGSRHVFHQDSSNDYSNRCTVFNHAGEVEWSQEKSQPFRLAAADALKLFGKTCPGAMEPTRLSNTFVLRRTSLGTLASPICLDFIQDPVWSMLPVHLYLVPAMTNKLNRFEHRCQEAGKNGAAAFVCNVNGEHAHLSYIPSRQRPAWEKAGGHLFIVTANIHVN